ncbi:hypothetical protein FZEAL_8699 [Fusarium zealandicum]|uniref:PD-(D/E)XK nuclease-like domain-containing protein n=1 Tax=Fusarium zealandicum TaxID=1053134 RepID=A0A8H4XHK9_9HYPO|nr:hypothetical protein FZEAL_8699 [Fusarium zealandicum]
MNGIGILPPDVHELYRRLQDIDDKEAFIPWEVSEDIKSLIPDRVGPRWFFHRDDTSTRKAEGNRTASLDTHGLTSPAKELQLLSQIESNTKQYNLSNCSTSSWNMHVHMPIMKHALEDHGTIRVEPSTSAKIAAPFVPATSGRGTIVKSKMIDFTLLFWLNKGSLRSIPHDPAPEDDARLMAGIAKKVRAQPRDHQMVNHSTYSPLQFAPIACNIETKTPTSVNLGKLQLSVWTAAWFQRIAEMFPDTTILTVPLIHIVGHSWHISFTSFHRDRIEIAKELPIGDSRTLLGLYQLVACLRRLGDWIETDYGKWAEQMFLGDI